MMNCTDVSMELLAAVLYTLFIWTVKTVFKI